MTPCPKSRDLAPRAKGTVRSVTLVPLQRPVSEVAARRSSFVSISVPYPPFSAAAGPSPLRNCFISLTRSLAPRVLRVRSSSSSISSFPAAAAAATACPPPPPPPPRRLAPQRGRTALHLAAEYGYAECVKALTDLGASLEAVDQEVSPAAGAASGGARTSRTTHRPRRGGRWRPPTTRRHALERSNRRTAA